LIGLRLASSLKEGSKGGQIKMNDDVSHLRAHGRLSKQRRRACAFRLIFAVYMSWLLVLFLPGHTRGQLTIGPRDPAGTVATKADSTDGCCESPKTKNDAPTPRDRANCAVCFWAAGLLPDSPVEFDLAFEERLEQLSVLTSAQWAHVLPIRESLGRDPPPR
jgi:hypothetical protein